MNMGLGEILLKERENSYIDHFLCGLYQSSTEISQIRFEISTTLVISENPLRERAMGLAGIYEIGEKDGIFCVKDFCETISYIGGRVFGFLGLPLDAGICMYYSIKDKIQFGTFKSQFPPGL